MRVLVVSGIWPPDVGGPASHAPDIAEYLVRCGHGVEAVVTASAPPEPRPYPVHWVRRRLPKGAVHVAAAAAIARAARRADVVYTTGMFARTAAACALVRRPYVVKLTGDPAFERARWRGRVGGDVEEFQHAGGVQSGLLRALRGATLSPAAHIVCPSAFLRSLAISWGISPERVSVLPNATPPLPELPPRDELRSSLGIDGPTLAFAGRFGPQKALDVALDAVARVDGVTLLLAGDGEIRPELEARAAPLGARVRFLGALSRRQVLELFAAADGLVLSSAWENFPHAVIEALAVGTPVIATAVGGVPEVVEDGVNGLLVQPNDVDALAGAIKRFFADDALRARLRAAAAPSVERYAQDAVYGELERILAVVVR
ncbi:MAG TPA: glycosyltransferase family 4 protein [Gaiellaceae bacterium]